jgi:polyhydroxyalkanoate synthase
VYIDPLNIANAFKKAFKEFYADPKKVVEFNMDLAKNYVDMLANVAHRSIGEEVAPLFAPDPKDKRFQDSEWDTNPLFDFIRQSYNLNSKWLMAVSERLHDLEPKDAQKINFYTRLLIDSLAPTNFPNANPVVIREAIATRGESLMKGAQHLYNDLIKSPEIFKITTADESAFEIGRNLAVTPGKVVYQNDLMQLIQYEPSTDKVYQTPIIVMPAWINKYYILDLQEKNSYVKWLVDQGYTVYMISWANPDGDMADKGFFDYMQEGPLAAIECVKKLNKVDSVHMVGYCLGGTLLTSTIAYLKAKSVKPFPIKSATFLASLVDFSEAGDLGVFIDEEQIQQIEERMSKKGYLDGKDMAQTFSIIRANDMIWSFFVNNYLLGKELFPFDILYWNSDPTRLPAKMHSFYLRNMYHKNLLVKPGGIKLDNVPIDVRKNDLPTYILATSQDHIVPWESAYIATQVYTGPLRFVLSGSGHVAGIVNPPDAKKYNYLINDKLAKKASDWLKGAKDNPGSWWLDWDKWCAPLSGEKVPARKINAKDVIENAPGSYVKIRI